MKKKMETSDNALRKSSKKGIEKAAEVKRGTRRDRRQYYHRKANKEK